MKATAAATLLCILLAGCASSAKITPEQLAAADYGQYPSNYEELVKNYFSTRLKDPYSAVYEITAPIKGYTRKAPIVGGGVENFGYVVSLSVNAKGGFGGYVGAKRYRLFIRDGVVLVQIYPNPTYFSEPWYQ